MALQEGVAIGRTFAGIRDYHIDGNKEMVAFGAMNLAGACTSCYVATGKHRAMIISIIDDLVAWRGVAARMAGRIVYRSMYVETNHVH